MVFSTFFWVFLVGFVASITDKTLGNTKQATVLKTVRSIPSLKLIDNPPKNNWLLLSFSVQQKVYD
jgi:hypothetical protein